MSVDRRRRQAAIQLEALGWVWDGLQWQAPAAPAVSQPAPSIEWEAASDLMHHVLVERADALAGLIEFDVMDELEQIGEAIEAYETVRWPTGRVSHRRP